MLELIQMILFAALAFTVVWSLILFLLSPFLMGDAAPELARTIHHFFLPQHLRFDIEIMRGAAVASAAIAMTPAVINLTPKNAFEIEIVAMNNFACAPITRTTMSSAL